MKLFDIKLIPAFKKTIILVFVFFISSVKIFSQNESIEQAAKQMQDKYPPFLQEKLFVHTDKTFYLPGEFIWFKIYDVDGLFNKPLDLSKVAYVEILNQ